MFESCHEVGLAGCGWLLRKHAVRFDESWAPLWSMHDRAIIKTKLQRAGVLCDIEMLAVSEKRSDDVGCGMVDLA